MSFLTDDPENLFAPPKATLKAPRLTPSADFSALFWRWEKYRLIYNAVLVAETILGLMNLPLGSDVFSTILLLAIVANTCFCAGIVLNGYLFQFGYHDELISQILFGAGLFLAMILTGISLFGMSIGLPVD